MKRTVLIISSLLLACRAWGAIAATGSVSYTAVVNDRAVIYWDAVPLATSYDVYRNGVVIDVSSNNIYNAAGLTLGSQYTFGLASRNDNNGDVSSVSAYVTLTAGVVVGSPAITGSTSGTTFLGGVTISSSALPSGAATSALQGTGNSSLSSLDGKTTVVNTGAVSVSSSALPSGAATSAAQTTGNNSLSSIDGKTTVVNTGAVSVSSSALPAGASTSSLQTTGNNSLASILSAFSNVTVNTHALGTAGNVSLTAGTAVIGALVANQSVNTAQINGVAPSMGSGVNGTGVQRVTVATDQAYMGITCVSGCSSSSAYQGVSIQAAVGLAVTILAGTNTIGSLASAGNVSLTAGTAVIGSLAANQSVNVAQMNGVATSMGSGANGTGVQRVTLATDQAYTGVSVTAALPAGSAVIGALVANQTVNTAQINGVAPSMGSGVNGTGVQRVTVATDQAYMGITCVSGCSSTSAYQGVSIFSAVGLAVTNLAGTAYIGAVGLSNSVGVAVSVTTGVAGISVTASQGGPFTVSGSVSTAGNVSINAGTSVIGALVANQSVNVAQVNGAAPSMGSGVNGTGVQRMTVATDQAYMGVSVTAALPTGANTIGSLTANQSVNVSQMNGVATSMGSGVNGTGVQRVTLATDQAYTGVSVTAALPTGANVIGALTANQTVNVAQVNGVAPSMGSGVNGTGVQRMTVATDQAFMGVSVTSFSGGLSVTNPASAAVQVAGSVTNNVTVTENESYVTGQATQTAAGNNIILAAAGVGATDSNGFRSFYIQVSPTGTVTSGVVTFEGSNDNSNFTAITVYDMANPSAFPVSSYSPATGTNRYFGSSISMRYLRARISTVIGGGGSLQAFTALRSDVFVPQMPYVSVLDTGKASYAASVTALASATTATDIMVVGGSATKTIRVTRITISATQTTGAMVAVTVLKRSTADTLGTAVPLTVTVMDSNSAAPSGTSTAYTANPTTGTFAGTLLNIRMFIPATTVAQLPYVVNFGGPNGNLGQAVVLRGTAQQVAISLNSTTVTGGIFSITAEWTEE